MHYQRWRRHADPYAVGVGGAALRGELNPNWSGDDASYFAVHLRLRRERGSASDFSCVDCGRPAAHWSYDNSDPNERIAPDLGRYSVDTNRYAARCVSCHRIFDNSARRALLTGRRPGEE